MKKIKFFNKFVAFSLAFIFLICSVPLEMVFANLQSNIKNLKISSANESNGYSINLTWENPSWSQSTDSSATNGSVIHTPEGYKVYQRKATTTAGTWDEIKDEKSTDLTATKLSNLSLKDGTIYEYKVVPYHYHTYVTSTGNVVKTAPMDTTTPEETVLFMTDIKVEASGSGNTLTVTFDNPKYNGKNIFSGYNIYYQKGGATATTFNSVITVNIENTDLIESYDSVREVNRLTYQITNNNIEQGNVYAVKIEPILNGKEIRDTSITDLTIEIDGAQKRLAFNSKSFVEYRTNEAHVSIPLSILEDGKEYLKLKWGDLSGVVPVGNIESIGIYSGDSESVISNLIGTIYSQDAISINSWRVNRPTETTYYQIRVKIQGIDEYLYSEIAVYNPTIVNVTPNKPEIYAKVDVQQNKSVLDIYWDAFVRPAYNSSEESKADASGQIVDTDVYYEVWITDSSQNLDALGLPKILDKVYASDLKQTYISETKNPVFNSVITKYWTVDSNGNFIEKEIEENKTYYIRIIATKPTADGLGLSSQSAETQIYVPARADISQPNELSKPPLKIKEDAQGIQMIEQTQITIEWSTKWYEIYDEKTETWHSKVAIRDGQLIFGNDIKESDTLVDFCNLTSEESVRQAFKNAGYSNYSNITIRQIDISQDNIKYELIVKPLDEINLAGGYEAYIEKLLNSDSDLWQEISPNYSGEKYAEYTIAGLNPNTRYAILLRPYRVLADGRKEAYPTYILATTLPEDTDLIIMPTTPVLDYLNKTDVSIEVYWAGYASGISYELAISEIIVDDPASARLISSSEIKENALQISYAGEHYYIYDIQNLFPETSYYIWIRATVDSTGEKSDWSNPIYVTTDTIAKPLPPSGLGLASAKNLAVYNSTNNTSYLPSDYDYLVIEWLRDAADTITGATATALAGATPLLDSNITNSYMVKFDELLANKIYYVRAKTIVYIMKNTDGSATKLYSYVIQISEREDFKDVIEIELPNVNLTGSKILMAESDWTLTYSFKTQKATGAAGDYDGNIDSEVYPLPTEDFEIIYDSATQTLTYRFRSNQKDANGNNDNLVDQRFITKLIENKVYDYKLDLTSYYGNSIKVRKVEIPYSILSAFEERKISLSIIVNGTTFKLNYGFLNTEEVKTLGTDSSVTITVAQNVATTPIIDFYNQTYTSTPQEISISINKNGISTPISYLGSDMDLDIKLNNKSYVETNNVSIYKDTDATLTWQKMESVYDSEKGSMSLKTRELGNYTTIAVGIKTADITGSLTAVNTKIVFTDLANIDLNSPISVVQFNNIIAGIANGKTEISINTALSTQDYNSLNRSGMLLSGAVVAREAGINVLLKLYELKMKYSYEPVTDVNTTQFTDIESATSSYQLSLVKAGELGFFGDSSLARPKDTMTIEEVLYILNIILDDCGY